MPKGSAPGERRGGRKKGVPNKMNIHTREQLRAYCDSIGADPGRVLADTMISTKEIRLRVLCAELLLDRLMPKLKSVEISGVVDRPLYFVNDKITPEERDKRLRRIAYLETQRAEWNDANNTQADDSQ